MDDLFQKATKKGLRFQTCVGGRATTEDLWSLPLLSASGPCLDDLWKSLNKKAKETSEESIILKVNKTNSLLELKLAVVKRIITIRLAEKEAREMSQERREKKERLMELVRAAKDKEDGQKSVEELLKMIDELDTA